MQKRMARRGGFTLVELIVVLVIIGILLALVIPNLTGYIDKAQATACRKNRAELMKIFTYEELLAEADGKSEINISTLLANTDKDAATYENVKRLECPNGGVYTYDIKTNKLVCNIAKHNAAGESAGYVNPMTDGVIAALRELDNQLGNGHNVDSGSKYGQYKASLTSLLSKNGASLDVATWRYETSGNNLYWTDIDINAEDFDATNQSIPVLKYDIQTKEYAVVLVKTVLYNKNINGNQDTYNRLDPGTKLVVGKASEDFSAMNAIYQAELEKYYKNLNN